MEQLGVKISIHATPPRVATRAAALENQRFVISIHATPAGGDA